MSVDNLISRFSGMTEPYFFYNGEVELHYDPKNHLYLLAKDGDLIPQDGVTSVVHIIDKSNALVPWACKMMAQKLLASMPPEFHHEDGKDLETSPCLPYQSFQNLVLSAKDAHKERLEEAGDIGHIAHAWVERYIKAILAHGAESIQVQETLAKFPEDERATNCCLAALDWMKSHNVRWLGTERKIYSRRYGYAGTMDGLCYVSSCSNPHCCKTEFKDRLTIADWKTSNYLYIEYLLQTAAYMQAFNEERAYENRCMSLVDEYKPQPLATDRWIIRLGKEDGAFQTWHAPEADYDLDRASFVTALALKRRTEEIQKRVKDRESETRASLKAEKKAAKETEMQRVKEEKAALQRLQKQKREATLKIKCPKADKFKGTRRPKGCNGTDTPCETCLAKYTAKHPVALTYEAVENNPARLLLSTNP